MTPLLDIHNLTVQPKGCRALIHDFSLRLFPSECLSIIGPNGSGKTTLLRTLIGELPVRSGKILLNGQSLTRIDRCARARSIALLSQHNDASPGLRVEEYVALGGLPWRGISDNDAFAKEMAGALENTGLTGLRTRRLGTLSGGERQRAALARVFVQRPQLLLLDEPTNHLDPLARTMLLAKVRAKNIAVIAVLHDLSLLSGFADRVAVMNEGRLVHQDDLQPVLNHPCIEEVFGMRCEMAIHPRTGKQVPLFEPISTHW